MSAYREGTLTDDVLSAQALTTVFPSVTGMTFACRDVDLRVTRGKTVGIVGESGSGKSVTCRSLIGLVPRTGEVIAGRVNFENTDLLTLAAPALRRLRGRDIAMIFQDPDSSLNPVYSVGDQIAEVLRVKLGTVRMEARRRSIELLQRVGFADPERQYRAYPFELSGGMRQRVMIACAIACKPKLLIADEPTTALDVTVQAQILELISDLQRETGMAVILVSHDFGVIAQYCDTVVVMYAGRIVEQGSVGAVLGHPAHPYTRALLDSIPDLDVTRSERVHPIRGQPPDLATLPPGCPFAPRCSHARPACAEVSMELQVIAGEHRTACPFVGEGPEEAW